MSTSNYEAAGEIGAATEVPTFCHLLSVAAARHSDRFAVSWGDDMLVRTMTWFDYRERVLNLAGAMLRLGVRAGDTVAILGRNCPEHLMADLAALHCGAVPVSVYPTMAAERIDHVLADCMPRIIVVEEHPQQRIVRHLPWVVANQPKLVLFDPLDDPNPPTEFTWDELLTLGADSRDWVAEELDSRIAAIEPSDPVTIVYTSGTTGFPKGVVLTHDNLLWEVEAMVRTGTVDYDYRAVSHLPLAHVAERLWSLYLPMRLGGHVFCCPEPRRLIHALQTHRPSFLMTVPRVWEKLHAAAQRVIGSAEFDSRRADLDRDRQILRQVAHARWEDRPVPAPEAVAAVRAREGLLRDVRWTLGLDKVLFAGTGAAPMSHDLRITLAAIGVDIHLGYGLTETSGPAACDRLGSGSRDSVGLPLPGADIRIAADGEVLVRSRGNTTGYWRAEDSAGLFTDQWLHTGDLGYFDAAGRLHITDRKKDLLITSSGENIAPAAIENRLAGESFIERTSTPDLPPPRKVRMFPEIFSVEGKTVLVTGGTRGIGYMIAEGYLKAGARVYISSRKEAACAEAAENLSRYGEVHAIPCDVSSEAQCRTLIEAVAARESALHVLVNNAGASWGAPFDEFPDAAWDKVLDANVKAPFTLTRLARPLLEQAAAEGDPARVINIGSIDGLVVPGVGNYSYSASKAAVHHLTRHMAAELAPSILVNAIAPGPFPSKMMAKTLEEVGDELRAASPLGRIGEPADIAATAVFLSSRASNFVTGAVIPLDGGLATTVGIRL